MLFAYVYRGILVLLGIHQFSSDLGVGFLHPGEGGFQAIKYRVDKAPVTLELFLA
jgi:hypothetical protein